MRKITLDELSVMAIQLHTDELLHLPKLYHDVKSIERLKTCVKFYTDHISMDKDPKKLKITQENILEARFSLLLIYALLEEERYDLEIILPDIQKKIEEAGENENKTGSG